MSLDAVAKALAWNWMIECDEAEGWLDDAQAIAGLKTAEEIAYLLCHRNGNCFHPAKGDLCPRQSDCAYAKDFLKQAGIALAAGSASVPPAPPRSPAGTEIRQSKNSENVTD